jgi:hypothetical protein
VVALALRHHFAIRHANLLVYVSHLLIRLVHEVIVQVTEWYRWSAWLGREVMIDGEHILQEIMDWQTLILEDHLWNIVTSEVWFQNIGLHGLAECPGIWNN